jgi:hypothetical protein
LRKELLETVEFVGIVELELKLVLLDETGVAETHPDIDTIISVDNFFLFKLFDDGLVVAFDGID